MPPAALPVDQIPHFAGTSFKNLDKDESLEGQGFTLNPSVFERVKIEALVRSRQMDGYGKRSIGKA